MSLAAWGFCEKRHKNAVLENTTFSSGPGQNGGLGRVPSGGSRARARVCGPRWLPPPSTGHVRPPVHMGRSVQTLRHSPILRTAMRGVTGGAGRPGRCCVFVS